MSSLPDFHNERPSDFRQVADAFLAQPGLPFARVVRRSDRANLCQASQHLRRRRLHDRRHGLVVPEPDSPRRQAGLLPSGRGSRRCSPTTNGRRRADLRHGKLLPRSGQIVGRGVHELTIEVGAEVEQQIDRVWLWKDIHCKLMDGFTFTMQDTPANQAAYPQPKTQKRGVGFPSPASVRFCRCHRLSVGVGRGPYSGKETGENALLRSLLKSFLAGDLVVADRYYCSFMMIALLTQQKVDVCTRLHQKRHADFRRGTRLGPDNHLITWTKPARPSGSTRQPMPRSPTL